MVYRVLQRLGRGNGDRLLRRWIAACALRTLLHLEGTETDQLDLVSDSQLLLHDLKDRRNRFLRILPGQSGFFRDCRRKFCFIHHTGGGEQSRRPYLWEYRDEHYDAVTAALERRFDVSAEHGIAEQMETIAAQLVNEYWQDNQYDILGTEDEIDANLSRGGSFEGGAGRVYSFWQQEHTPKEKADFLKHEYGTGGGNNAISRNFHSWEDHSAKGITLRKPNAEEVNLSWAKVAKRIDALVAKDRYLTPEGKAAWEKAQAENGVRAAAVNEYNAIKEAHPDEIVLFQVGKG